MVSDVGSMYLDRNDPQWIPVLLRAAKIVAAAGLATNGAHHG